MSKKKLRKLERRVEILEAEVKKLSKEKEDQETADKLFKILGRSAEIITIIAGVIAIIQTVT